MTYASVMALVVRNIASVNVTVLVGVDEPQKMIPETRHVPMK
jgi:hypothetical protein